MYQFDNKRYLRFGEDKDTIQQNEIAILKRRVKKLEKKKRFKNTWAKMLHKVGMFDVDTLTGDELKPLAAVKMVKPTVKRDVIEEPSVPVSAASASTKVSAVSASKSNIALREQKRKRNKRTNPKLNKENHVYYQKIKKARFQRLEEQTLILSKMFDKAFKRSRRDEIKNQHELQSLMEVILDEEEVTIDAVPLAIKSPSIVGWKIHKEGKKSYYQIMRADRKSQMYRIFSHMLKSFSREDL
ncbi:hypothetical protein Tco_0012153 [Tanacetum coccineum]